MKTKHFLAITFMLCLVFLAKAQNPPVAVNDTIVGEIYTTISVNVLQNDIDPNGDSLMISHVSMPQAVGQSYITCGTSEIQDSIILVILNFHALDFVRVDYTICKKNNPLITANGVVWIITTNMDNKYLDINNVSAMFSSSGNHFYNFSENGHYRVPKNSVKNTFFSASSWIGGKDPAGNIHVAAELYRSEGEDYWAGPISDTSSYTMVYDNKWNYIWKLKRTEIEYHKTHWWTAGYYPISDIANWPGNGDTNLGQSAILAPFHDNNGNGIYEPFQGDYPVIKGDECLYFIFNDSRNKHMESQGKKLGVEVHGMAYAFNCPSDSALNLTTFLHYELINRSDTTYDSTFFGFFADSDLGYSWDDYIGCNVEKGAFYTYNGRKIDGSGLPDEYGAFPPVQAVVALGGPFLDNDNTDNLPYDSILQTNCSFGINGLNFGDGIIDNERYGMTGFSYFTNCTLGPTCDPNNASEYYKFLKSTWKDGVHMRYGGNGHPNSGAIGPESRFMFPDISDPCDWGTNGIAPSGFITGAGGSGTPWTESEAGNLPSDRRGLMIMGPFHFQPGKSEFIDLAFVFARNYTDSSATAAVPILNNYIDSIRHYFKQDYSPCGGSFTVIPESRKPVNQLVIFPNPTGNFLNVRSNILSAADYTIMDSKGSSLNTGKLEVNKTNVINVSGLKNGVYIFSINTKNEIIQRKFVVIK